MSASLAAWLISSKAANNSNNPNNSENGLDFAEERRKRAQARKKAAALAEKAKLSAAGDNKPNSAGTSVTSNSTCQLLQVCSASKHFPHKGSCSAVPLNPDSHIFQLSSGQSLPSLLDEFSSEFSVAHLSLNILAHERLQQSLEDRLVNCSRALPNNRSNRLLISNRMKTEASKVMIRKF
ncbi:hypothetical protein WR25_17586 [Diploscapter pachys]|uniref:Uncharacterized protein n=1 Tax=Diploscapter pachys TaxID=2018661 RepID=A0A2A2J335_9BILA|nr:hypothetical protein WR25_17586 [Diploscapter pachys]